MLGKPCILSLSSTHLINAMHVKHEPLCTILYIYNEKYVPNCDHFVGKILFLSAMG